ncbi:hypothetical protein PoB_003131800 [Plakobranchus ocellatus]|uniref:Uncharacterized protein n=1 Tax=Plakobranchus ocellatus TaxID=259542 RepID=A0AAV4AE31_9GAST|nr:hypothetical protein PoB_003131800 [Plakobranchus ocellatus]
MAVLIELHTTINRTMFVVRTRGCTEGGRLVYPPCISLNASFVLYNSRDLILEGPQVWLSYTGSPQLGNLRLSGPSSDQAPKTGHGCSTEGALQISERFCYPYATDADCSKSESASNKSLYKQWLFPLSYLPTVVIDSDFRSLQQTTGKGSGECERQLQQQLAICPSVCPLEKCVRCSFLCPSAFKDRARLNEAVSLLIGVVIANM